MESVNAGIDTASKTNANKVVKAKSGQVDASTALVHVSADAVGAKGTGPDKSFAELLATLPLPIQVLLTSLEDYTFSLGDDVQRKELRLYVAFKRLKNFATVVLHKKNCLLLFLHVNPATAVSSFANARDVTNIGHWGTGNLELTLSFLGDLEAAKPFIMAAYEGKGPPLASQDSSQQ